MTDLPAARAVCPAGHWTGAHDQVTLTYDERFLRRKRLTSAKGESFVVDLAETVSLGNGDALLLEDGRLIEVLAASEPLVEITGAGLARLAWHIGNRHTPCQIEAGRLLIRRDHVLEQMLTGLGALTQLVEAPFVPEGGAYGPGRTMGHAHGPAQEHTEAHRHVQHHGAHLHTAEDDAEEDGDPA